MDEENHSYPPSARCWYFHNTGTCRLGVRCNYPHLPRTDPPVCRYFQQGRCAFGRHCRNIHGNSSAIQNEQEGNAEAENGSLPAGHSSHTERLNMEERSVPSGQQNTEVSERSQSGSSRNSTSNNAVPLTLDNNEWVHAPEFIPSVSKKKNDEKTRKSYAEVLNPNAQNFSMDQSQIPLCPYAEAGECKQVEECPFLHGLLCDYCGKACLHPFNLDQQKKHNTECIISLEKDMEISFAIARSKEKTCGICFEVVMEKSPQEQRFGILSNCNHCFCLHCIRTWRQATQFESSITRACPECRVSSDFVCPSIYWVETKEDKTKLITDYRVALGMKDCKYFKKGNGTCPFGNKCFYQHVLPDGTVVNVGPPRNQRRQNANGNFFHQDFVLWDFLEARDRNFEDFFSTDSDSLGSDEYYP